MRAPTTKYEKETIINFNEEESTAIVSTYNKALLKKLESYSERSSDCRRINGDDEFGEYIVPKRWVKVLFPRQYSDEQRSAMSQRFKNRLEKNNG